MPARENALKEALSSQGSVGGRKLRRLTEDDMRGSAYFETAQEVYRRLGGIKSDFPVNPRATWDIEFEGIAVELDEQLHFNRYRAITLSAQAYESLNCFPLNSYLSYCSRHEDACLRAGKHGKKWTNPSCERQFGASSLRGQLDGAGPARWRQRAFYDSLKDVASLIIGFPVVRLAIWDEVYLAGKMQALDWILRNPSEQGNQAIMSLIESRLPGKIS